MRWVAIVLIMLVSACTTTETVVDRVEVPVPVREEIKDIKELPERTELRSKKISPEEARADTEKAFEALGEDIGSLLAENEVLRHLYNELVKRIKTPPEEAPE